MTARLAASSWSAIELLRTALIFATVLARSGACRQLLRCLPCAEPAYTTTVRRSRSTERHRPSTAAYRTAPRLPEWQRQ